MNSIKIPFENSIKMSITHQNSRQWNRIILYSIEIPPISHFFNMQWSFSFFPVKKPEVKDKGGLLTGTSWLKKQKFQQKSEVVKLP